MSDIVSKGIPSGPGPGFASTGPANFEYRMVDVTDAVCDVLALGPSESLRQSFGVGGPPPASVIGVGDSVTVTIWEAGPGGLFSSAAPISQLAPGSRTATIPEQVVARDGTIGVPYAGRLRVLGLKPEQVESAIVERLKGKAIEPQAVVAVTRNVSNTVSVTGEVTNGARVPLTVRGDRVLDVIAAAGGLHIPANEAYIRLMRGNRTASVSFNAVQANPSENIFLRGGDVLSVVRRPQTFTVAGATGLNAVVPFGADSITLDEAVAKAGGLLDYRADPQGVFVFRFESVNLVQQISPDPRQLEIAPEPVTSSSALASSSGSANASGVVPVIYRLNFRDASSYFLARKFEVRDKDFVYVANSPASELQKFLGIIGSAISPAVSSASTAATVATVH
jgi:polysaccharide biosynthesis/export protein